MQKKRFSITMILLLSMVPVAVFCKPIAKPTLQKTQLLQKNGKKKKENKNLHLIAGKETKKSTPAKKKKSENSKARAVGVEKEIIVHADGKITTQLPDASTALTRPVIELLQPKHKGETSEQSSQPNQLKLIKDTNGDNFRFKIDTSSTPAYCILPTRTGFWLLLDRKYEVTLPGKYDYEPAITDIHEVDNNDITIIAFDTDQFLHPLIETVKDSSYLTFFYRGLSGRTPAVSAPSMIKINDDKWTNVAISPVADNIAEKKVRIQDTDYFIYFSKVADGGNESCFQTSNYEILPTHQGFALKNFSVKNNFIIDESTLTLSNSLVVRAENSIKKSNDFQNILYFPADKGLDEERKKLIHKRNSIKEVFPLTDSIELTYIYIMSNMPIEAKTILRNVAIQWPRSKVTPVYKFLLGMCYFLSREYKQAYDQWRQMPAIAEIEFLKQLALSKLGYFDKTDHYIYKANAFISFYPWELREYFLIHCLMLAEKLFNNGGIQEIISKRENFNTILGKLYFELYQAKVAHRKHDYSLSSSFLQNVNLQKSKDKITGNIIVEHDFMKAINSYNLKHINTQAYIDTIYALKHKWRGDHLEYTISLSIAKTLIENKEYERALKELTTIKRVFPKMSQIDLTEKQIYTSFASFFDDLKSIPPLRIIKTFNEYIKFLPVGDEGEKIAHKVAEQFVKIDLLDEATEILSRYQASKINTVDDVEKVINIIQLKLISKKFQEAQALVKNMPHEIVTTAQKKQLLTLEAKALLGENNKPKAMEILETSTDAVHIIFAATLAMDDRDWKKAATNLITASCFLNEEHHAKELKHVIKLLANTYVMMNDIEKIKELSQKYKNLMKDDPDFAFISNHIQMTAQGRDEAEKVLKETDAVTAYIKDAIEKIKK